MFVFILRMFVLIKFDLPKIPVPHWILLKLLAAVLQERWEISDTVTGHSTNRPLISGHDTVYTIRPQPPLGCGRAPQEGGGSTTGELAL